MKLIEALEAVLITEQRLGDSNFNYDRAELNDFFTFKTDQPIQFPKFNSKSEASHQVPHEVPAPIEAKAEPIKVAFDTKPREIKSDKRVENFTKVENKPEDISLVSYHNVSLDELRTKALSCDKCMSSFKDSSQLKLEALSFVFDAVISKGDLQNPLSGPSGDFFKKMLSAMKISTESLNIIQIHRCPRGGDMNDQTQSLLEVLRKIKPSATVLYSPRVLREISEFESLHEGRGKWINWNELKIMPSYSPAFLMRSENVYGKTKKKEAWEDLQKVMSVL